MRPAEEGFLFAAAPVAEPEEVAAAPDKLDLSVSELNAEPDWKQVLVQLLQVLEQFGDRLPLVVLAEKRKIEALLAGKGPGRPEGAAFSTPTRRYNKVMKLDAEGNRRWTVKAHGERNAWGTFEIESDADDAIADLLSPVVSLSDIGPQQKCSPRASCSNVPDPWTCMEARPDGPHELGMTARTQVPVVDASRPTIITTGDLVKQLDTQY